MTARRPDRAKVTREGLIQVHFRGDDGWYPRGWVRRPAVTELALLGGERAVDRWFVCRTDGSFLAHAEGKPCRGYATRSLACAHARLAAMEGRLESRPTGCADG